jgi:outer membrane autotransporter protein
VGQVIELGKGYSLIPQGQLIYQRTDLTSGADLYGQINFSATDELYGRLGAQLAKTGRTDDSRTASAWVTASVWRQFLGGTQVTFAKLDGSNATPVSAGLGGTWAQFSLGGSGEITHWLSVFGILETRPSFGNQAGHSLADQAGARVGLRVIW